MKFAASSLISIIAIAMSCNMIFADNKSYTSSRATYYGSKDFLGTPTGACGFGEFGRNMNKGDVAAAAQLYKDGSGCGACYQVRCLMDEVCKKNGVKIVVTDYGQGDNTDFIMSTHAFSKLSVYGRTKQLLSMGVVDIEYKRISCKYPGHNIMFKIDESSSFPNYLAVILWYQAGHKDVIGMEYYENEICTWKAMRRSHGGVWEAVMPPRDSLEIKLLVSDAFSAKQDWVYTTQLIPPDWTPGSIYDSGIQLS